MIKQFYLLIVSIISWFSSFGQVQKRVVYLLSFPDNNHGLIEALSEKFPTVVLYTRNCKKEAHELEKQGIRIYSLDSNVSFFFFGVPLITRSRIIICDNYFPFLGGIQKKEQKIIQIWHAIGAIKRFGLESNQKKNWKASDVRRYKSVYNTFDQYVVASRRMGEVFQRSYGAKEKQMLYFGLPRTDSLLNKSKVIRSKSDRRQVILYAPTYRENQRELPPLDLSLLEQELGQEYRLMIKLHPHVHELGKKNTDTSFVRWVESEETLMELMLESDILISDYSSVLFDFSLIKPQAPILLYWYDLETYEKESGIQKLFLKDSTLPIVKTTEEIIQNLRLMNKSNSTSFNQEWNTYNNGDATNRLLEYIENNIGGSR